MAIGTQIQIGMDSTAVKRGLAALPGLFKRSMGKAMGALKVVGRGAGYAAGGDLFGMVKDALLFVPRELGQIRELADTYGNLSRATGLSTAELMKFSKALELSGLQGDLAIDAIREAATKFGEAVTDGGEPLEALKDLGVDRNLLNGTVADQFMRVSNAVDAFKGTSQELAFVFDRLFGGDLGAKLIPFFKDYNKWTDEAAHSSRGFADALLRNRESLSLLPRIGSTLRQKFREALLASFESTNQMGSHGILKQLVRYVEGLDVSKLAAVFNRVFKAAMMGGEWLIGAIKEKGFSAAFGEAFSGLGDMLRQTIADGIRLGLKEGFNFWDFMLPSMKGLPGMGNGAVNGGLRQFFGKDKAASKDRATSQLIDLNRQQARSLAKIERSGFPAVSV